MENKKKWYRKWNLDVSKEEVMEVIAKYNDPQKYSKSSLSGPYTPADSDALVGKTLTFRGEGKVFSFEFTGLNALRFTEDGGETKECFCNVKTMDNELYLINHLVPGYAMSRQITLIIDTVSGCATVCDAHFGTENSNIDVAREFIFGRLDGDYAGGELHHFTDEMVGRAVEWEYSPDVIRIKHIYISDLFYSYCANTAKGAWMASNPADFIKVRDNVFLFSFVEERQAGLQALFLIDFNRMHDVGSFYGVGSDHVTSACVGAIGKPVKMETVFK